MTPSVINILSVEPSGEFKLRLTFDDGSVQTVDFRPFLAGSRHPDIRLWLDPTRFAQYRIEFGELVWGDSDLCFPVMDLYQNRIEHREELEAAA